MEPEFVGSVWIGLDGKARLVDWLVGFCLDD